MPVRFLCPTCHQLLSIASRKIGAEVDCPKCRSTIVVPQPESSPDREGANPFDEAGLEQTLSALTPSDKPHTPLPPLTNSSAAAPLLHGSSEIPPIDDSLIAISRRMLYLQAILLAVVAIVAFLCGYFIGGAK